MSDTYQPFGDSKEEYELAPPTNTRVKKVTRSELKMEMGQVSEKVETAKVFGWKPEHVIPGYADEEGQESSVEAIGLTDHMASVVEICLQGADPTGREGEVRMDEARRAKADFMRRANAINGATGR